MAGSDRQPTLPVCPWAEIGECAIEGEHSHPGPGPSLRFRGVPRTMDPEPLRVLSLFAGIGGIDLGLERAGMRVVAHSEIDPYASQVLAKHWPDVPNLGDVTTIDWTPWVGKVDVIAGGFPCTDVSSAGKKQGVKDGKQSGLWSEFARAIRDLRPRYVIVENVADLVARGLDIVLGDLAACGFDAEWRIVSAAEVGAPHRRRRIWIVAYPNGGGLEVLEERNGDEVSLAALGAAWRHDADGLGFHEHWREACASDLQREVDGISNGVDRLRCLGNAVVPPVAEFIGRKVVAHAT